MKKSLLKPTFNKERYKCPFYGFSHPLMGMFRDQDGNQCPLYEEYTPCQMEIENQTPNWEKCLINNKENGDIINRIINSHRFAPREFWPKGKSSWKGLQFERWTEYVMGENVKRP